MSVRFQCGQCRSRYDPQSIQGNNFWCNHGQKRPANPAPELCVFLLMWSRDVQVDGRPNAQKDGDNAALVDSPCSTLCCIRVPLWRRCAVFAMQDYHREFQQWRALLRWEQQLIVEDVVENAASPSSTPPIPLQLYDVEGLLGRGSVRSEVAQWRATCTCNCLDPEI
jgi:hypothetical protein